MKDALKQQPVPHRRPQLGPFAHQAAGRLMGLVVDLEIVESAVAVAAGNAGDDQ